MGGGGCNKERVMLQKDKVSAKEMSQDINSVAICSTQF